MANTYVAIATTTVGSGGAAEVSFTSIPATFTDLYCVFSHRTTSGIDAVSYALGLKINGVTTNRTWRRLEAYNGTSKASDNGSTGLVGVIQGSGSTANTFASLGIYIPNYLSSNNKSFSIDAVTEENGSGGQSLDLIAGLWSSSSTITDLAFYSISGTPGNFAQYSTATLYGIKNS